MLPPSLKHSACRVLPWGWGTAMDLILGSGAVALDEPSGLGGQLAPRSAHPVVVGSDFRARTLLIGESLFSKGDPKTHLHEISSGLVGVYGSQPGCIDEVIEFAFPGDVLGLGYLDHHVHYARALIKTQVKCLPLGALAEIIKHDLRAKHRYAVAVQRELHIAATFFREQLGRTRSPDWLPFCWPSHNSTRTKGETEASSRTRWTAWSLPTGSSWISTPYDARWSNLGRAIDRAM